MFYTGSEIIIISSNIKRKSGPKVGSMGIVIDRQHFLNYNQDMCIQPIKVLFTRYGFEKKKRFETKRIYINTPRIPSNINFSGFNYKKLINKLSTCAYKHDFKEPCVVASPLPTFQNNVFLYMFSCLKSNYIKYELETIAFSRRKQYKHITDKIQNTLFVYLRELLQCRNNKSLLYMLYNMDKKDFMDLLKLIRLFTALHIRLRQKDVPIKINIPFEEVNKRLFMEPEYDALKEIYGKTQKELFLFVNTFKKTVTQQGNLVYKAHQG